MFSYRHWSSYIRNTLRDDLMRVPARIYLAQGTADVAVPSAVSTFSEKGKRNRPVDVWGVLVMRSSDPQVVGSVCTGWKPFLMTG
jgi:hypothetical protein